MYYHSRRGLEPSGDRKDGSENARLESQLLGAGHRQRSLQLTCQGGGIPVGIDLEVRRVHP